VTGEERLTAGCSPLAAIWNRIARAFGLGRKSGSKSGSVEPPPVDRIIVGLGNPGAKYARTRHNAGFFVLDALAGEVSADWVAAGGARTCHVEIAGCRTLLVEPLTYMNRSGEVLPALLDRFGLEARDIVVIFDDLSLPLGRIRVRERGSAGGHHGLESIMSALDTDEVIRVRLGIGEEHMPKDKAGYVLSDFPEEKQAELDDMIAKAGAAVRGILKDGVAQTMAIFNGSVCSRPGV
jgi:PTH1 family peptidyl-tRNA hydrolase